MDPQEGGARGAHAFVWGGVCSPNALVQSLFFRAPVRAHGTFGPGVRGHLGALRAPDGARWRCGGHRVAFPAEVAGVWEVGERRPGAETADPESSDPLAEGVPELQQAGADAAPVVPAERLLPDLLPCVVGENPLLVEGGDEASPRRTGVPLGVGLPYTCGARWDGAPACTTGTRPRRPGGGGPVGCRPRLPPTLPAACRSRLAPGAARLQGRWGACGVRAQECRPARTGRPRTRGPNFELRHGEPGGSVLQGVATEWWPRCVFMCVSLWPGD